MAESLLKRLNHRIDVYGHVEDETEFCELTYGYKRISSVWAEIVPKTGRENNIQGESIQVSVTHKITIRSRAIKKPRNDMYFEFRGQRYEVLYFMPHYKNNELIEFYCKLIIETEEDYNGD